MSDMPGVEAPDGARQVGATPEGGGRPARHAGLVAAFGEGRRAREAEYAVVLTLVLFIAGTAAVGLYVGIGEVAAELRRLSVGVLAGILLLTVVNLATRALRWQVYTRRLGLEVPLGRSVVYYMAGFAMSPTPGKLGEVLRLWLLERCHGVPYDRSVPMLLGDRISDTLVLVLFCLLGVAAFTDHLLATAALVLFLGLLMLLLVRPRLLLLLALHLYGAIGRWARLFGRIRLALRRTAFLFDPRTFLLSTALAAVGWTAQALGLAWLLDSLDQPVGVIEAAFVFAFATLVGGISMLPGGLGSTDATMLALLIALGVGSGTAITVTAVIRVATLWFSVGLGFLFLPSALRLARSTRPAPPAA
jgi:glycosyltransferase 2 family protein